MGLLQPPKTAGVWATERGQLHAWSPGPGLVIVKLSGYLETALVPKFSADFNRTWPAQLRGMFFDTSAMNGYDSAFRTGMTDWVRSIKDRAGTLHVWVESKLVSMGVAVANLALGGILRTHRTKAALEGAIQRALAER